MAKVSVIIPVYNAENFLRICLDSVTNQTLSDIEIICIDDCSTDSSKEILKEYAEKDSRFVILENEKNSGQAFSRNKALEKASGEYIQFVDADDDIEQDVIEISYNMAKQNNLDVLKTNCILYSEKIVSGKELLYDADVVDKVFSGKDMIFEMTSHNCVQWATWTSFVRTDHIRSSEVKFYNGIIYEDVLFSFEVLLNAERCMCANLSKYHYIKRETSTTVLKKTERNLYGYLVCMTEVLRKGLSDPNTLRFKYSVIKYFMRMNAICVGIKCEINKEFDTSGWSDDIADMYNMFISGKKSLINRTKMNECIDEIKKYQKVYIYGAGASAKSLIPMLNANDILLSGVAVSDTENNPNSFFGHKIHCIDDFIADKDDALILVAITEKYVGSVISDLKEKGFKNIIHVCSE